MTPLKYAALAVACGLTFCRHSNAAVHPFTVVDEIGISLFSNANGGGTTFAQLSPDGKYFAVYVERGQLQLNQVEGSLRVYLSADLQDFVHSTRSTAPPAPLWTITRDSSESPAIDKPRWLPDGSGIAFLEQGLAGTNRLALASITKKSVTELTPDGKSVKAFDVRDSMHYAYVLANEGLVEKALAEHSSPALTLTGRPLFDVIFSPDRYPRRGEQSGTDRGELWAVFDGTPTVVRRRDGTPVTLFEEGERNFVLSPDGASLITAVALSDVPAAWESRYAPPEPNFPYRLRAGKQDLSAFSGSSFISEYVRIDLHTGAIEPLTSAPIAPSAGWFAAGVAAPRWSEDGTAILLPGTFIDSDGRVPARPCVALYVELSSRHSSCLELLKGDNEVGVHFTREVRFERGSAERVRISFQTADGQRGESRYRRLKDGRWLIDKEASVKSKPLPVTKFEVRVKEDLNDPPVLMISGPRSKQSRTLWDPNPQLKDLDLGTALVYQWKDARAREWKGGLYRPRDYAPSRHYPLVVQTHGFSEHEFTPSGVFPTAMAARALAAVGILVVQVGENPCQLAATEEGACSAGGYESAVKQLLADGLVDGSRIGIIGFSRTCYSVMHLLTTTSLNVVAASVTDGVMDDYLQYMHAVDFESNLMVYDFDATVGARPFGAGLEMWRQRSPLFNVDKVRAALLVVGEGEASLLGMWGPYAAMRLLKKPTELILLNTDEHVLSNPASRLASQGGSVDWFRFWLQGYEDPDPGKADQYKRWEALCDMQIAANPGRPTFCAPSNKSTH